MVALSHSPALPYLSHRERQMTMVYAFVAETFQQGRGVSRRDVEQVLGLTKNSPYARGLLHDMIERRFIEGVRCEFFPRKPYVYIPAGAAVVDLTKPCYVYVMAVPSGASKIGITTDLNRRLFGVQTANHEPVSLIHSHCFKDTLAAKAAEDFVKAELKVYHKHGDWFNASPAMLVSAITAYLGGKRHPRPLSMMKPTPPPIPPVEPPPRGASDERYYEAALQVGRNFGYISTAMLQRQLRIGFPRAARLIDMMEDRGALLAYGIERRRRRNSQGRPA